MDITVLKNLLGRFKPEEIVGKSFRVQDTSTGDTVQVTLGSKQFVFLHIPKTGGTYVSRNSNVIEPIFDLNHSVLVKMPYSGNQNYPPDPGYRFIMREDVELVKNNYTLCFATVRNPFDWFVSYWCHTGKDLPEDSYPAPDHYDYKIARKGFDYFLKSIAEREDGWPSRKLLYFAFFEYNSNFIVDYLIHQEDLDSELEEFANKFNSLQYQKNEHRARVSSTRERDYRIYYTDELVDLVNEVWGRDLFLFGYDFNGKVSGFFEENVTNSLKSRVQYLWEDDKLLIDNQEVSG